MRAPRQSKKNFSRKAFSKSESPRANKSLGQNFLNDANVLRKILLACNLSKEESILEIGAGRGAITEHLMRQAKRVLAVETDARLVEILEKKFSGTNVEVIHADILKLDLENLPAGIKVIGNLPYYICAPIIVKLLEHPAHFQEMFFTVQKEFAERICAKPGSRTIGAFSHFVQYHCVPKSLFTIPAGCFRPIPKVDSSFIQLKTLGEPTVKVEDEEFLFEMIRTSFQQRRKTLSNSLSTNIPREKIHEALAELNIDPQARCETLKLQDFARLADYLKNSSKR